MRNSLELWSDSGSPAERYIALSAASLDDLRCGSYPTNGLRSFSLDNLLDSWIDRIAVCPWGMTAGSITRTNMSASPAPVRSLYTPEERRRRDATGWTMVQGVLAPIQFAVFLVSLSLVLNYLATGRGYEVATASIVAKTIILYVIMVTGSIWEKKVFDTYLLTPAFFWEDIVSMLVLALHTAYMIALVADLGSAEGRMLLALAAYASYALNATQFILKLRAARLQASRQDRNKLAAGQAK
jgi:3-vinyl bacteriochlorophyllide hydratase